MNLLPLLYHISSVTFILGLNMLSHPKSAKKGNLLAAIGMTIAIFGTIFLYESIDASVRFSSSDYIGHFWNLIS